MLLLLLLLEAMIFIGVVTLEAVVARGSLEQLKCCHSHQNGSLSQ